MGSRNEIIFDLLIAEAAERYLDELAAQYPTAEELVGKHKFSDEFERKMELIIKQEEKRQRVFDFKKAGKHIARFGKKASVAVCVAFTLLLMTAFTFPEIKAKIINFMMEDKGDHIEMSLLTENDVSADINIPEGFEVVEYDENAAGITATFKNASGEQVLFDSFTSNAQLNIDNEGTEFREVMIGDYAGYAISKKGLNIIIFSDSSWGYEVISEIELEKLIEIAEEIVK